METVEEPHQIIASTVHALARRIEGRGMVLQPLGKEMSVSIAQDGPTFSIVEKVEN